MGNPVYLLYIDKQRLLLYTALQYKQHYENLKIYKTSSDTLCLLFVCMSVNVKTTEPIGPKFCVGLHMAPRKVYE